MEDSFPITEPFDSKELIIAEKPSDFEEIEKEVEGLRLKDLRRYIDRIRSSGIDVKSYEVKYHYKISLSFIPLVMCLLGVPFSVRSRRQGGMALDLSLCLVVMGLYWLFYSLARSLGENGSLNPIVAVWSPSLIFSALAVFLLYKKRRQFG